MGLINSDYFKRLIALTSDYIKWLSIYSENVLSDFQNATMIRSGPSTMYSPTGTSDSSGFSERDSGFSTGCGNQPPPAHNFRSNGGFTGFQRSESPNIAERVRTGSPGINKSQMYNSKSELKAIV